MSAERRYSTPVLLLIGLACSSCDRAEVPPRSSATSTTVGGEAEVAKKITPSSSLTATTALKHEIVIDDASALSIQNQAIRHRVRLRNDGLESVTIVKITRSCNCLSTTILRGVAAPGEELEVELSVAAPIVTAKTALAFIACDNGDLVTASVSVRATAYTRVWIAERDAETSASSIIVMSSREVSPPIPVVAASGADEVTSSRWVAVSTADGHPSSLWKVEIEVPKGIARVWQVSYGDTTIGWVSSPTGERVIMPD